MPAPLGAQPAPAPVVAPDQTQRGDQFSTAQLESLLAPIALYPDTLLTQLLMATTNPLEIVAASRWLAQGSNHDLKGKALEDALRSQPWDPAVKSPENSGPRGASSPGSVYPPSPCGGAPCDGNHTRGIAPTLYGTSTSHRPPPFGSGVILF